MASSSRRVRFRQGPAVMGPERELRLQCLRARSGIGGEQLSERSCPLALRGRAKAPRGARQGAPPSWPPGAPGRREPGPGEQGAKVSRHRVWAAPGPGHERLSPGLSPPAGVAPAGTAREPRAAAAPPRSRRRHEQPGRGHPRSARREGSPPSAEPPRSPSPRGGPLQGPPWVEERVPSPPSPLLHRRFTSLTQGEGLAGLLLIRAAGSHSRPAGLRRRRARIAAHAPVDPVQDGPVGNLSVGVQVQVIPGVGMATVSRQASGA